MLERKEVEPPVAKDKEEFGSPPAHKAPESSSIVRISRPEATEQHVGGASRIIPSLAGNPYPMVGTE